MKMFLIEDEQWPVYFVSDRGSSFDRVIEFSDDEWADFERVQREYEAWQLKLRSVYRKTVEAFDE